MACKDSQLCGADHITNVGLCRDTNIDICINELPFCCSVAFVHKLVHISQAVLLANDRKTMQVLIALEKRCVSTASRWSIFCSWELNTASNRSIRVSSHSRFGYRYIQINLRCVLVDTAALIELCKLLFHCWRDTLLKSHCSLLS